MTEHDLGAQYLHGKVAPGDTEVLDAFDYNLQLADRTGAALSVWRDGREVVNGWGGTADHRTGRLWDENTLQAVFSASKGLSVIVLGRMHERGELDLLAPIRTVWPEFAQRGKGDISIADVLAHRAGVSAPLEDPASSAAISSSPVGGGVVAPSLAAPTTPGTG